MFISLIRIEMKRLSSLLFAMLFVLGCSTGQKEQPETEYVTVNLDFSPDYEIQPLVKSSINLSARCLEPHALQSTRGSEKPPTCPDATHV